MGFLSNKIWVRIFLSHPVHDVEKKIQFSVHNFHSLLIDNSACKFQGFHFLKNLGIYKRYYPWNLQALEFTTLGIYNGIWNLQRNLQAEFTTEFTSVGISLEFTNITLEFTSAI